MKPSDKRKFGRVDLEVTTFAFGTAPIGNIFREIDDKTADGMIQQAWDAGVRFYDTAPMYGHGLSELRTGQALRWQRRELRSVPPRPVLPPRNRRPSKRNRRPKRPAPASSACRWIRRGGSRRSSTRSPSTTSSV